MERIRIGFSPCPNDTFIFDALLHQKVDTEGLRFEAMMEDVEALNRRAFNHELEVTKLSYHAFGHLLPVYALLDSGSALGHACGPMLIARAPVPLDQIAVARIAIPGKMTTANFLLSLAYPEAKNKIEMVFSEVEHAVLNGDADLGLIIHENRFTYAEKGLVKVLDLGEYWEENTQLPIPLGAIVVKRDLPLETGQKINRVLRRSVEYAFANREDVMPFVRQYAQEMDPLVQQAHIDLYVTHYTVDLGEKGRHAVEKMFQLAREKGLLEYTGHTIWLESGAKG